MKSNWPFDALTDLLGIELPIIQAPMAAAQGAELAIAVAQQTGGLGSLACMLLEAEDLRNAVEQIRQATNRPFNLNFFCHRPSRPDAEAQRRWQTRLATYYAELGVEARDLLEALSNGAGEA